MNELIFNMQFYHIAERVKIIPPMTIILNESSMN